jgi:uncharacterized cofD-like protein
VVALGGGTGLPVLLRGLREVLLAPGDGRVRAGDRERITAIVTTADDGGSTGRLRRAYRIPAPGDLRNCLVALAGGNPALEALFDFRFRGDADVGGHSLGNLILTALHLQGDDFLGAVERAGDLLRIRGRVLPCTLDQVALVAEYGDGIRVEGESRLALHRRPIRRVRLRPREVRALPQAVQAIEAADLIVLGPGSLYTSLLPVLLVQGIAAAIKRSGARVALVINLMTEPGETDGRRPADLVRIVRTHVPRVQIHDVLLNATPIPDHLLKRYALQGSIPIPRDSAPLRDRGIRVLETELLADGPSIRHDSIKLARAALGLVEETGRLSRTAPSAEPQMNRIPGPAAAGAWASH